ncbi:protein HIS-72, isoform b, partial [Ephemerocybe angulata]
ATTTTTAHLPHTQWPAPSKPPASPPVVRRPASSSLPSPLPARPLPQQLVVSRSPIVSGPEPSLSVKSGDTRSRPSSSSANSPSSVLSVKLLRTSRPTSASNPPPSWLSRRPPRPTSSPSSRTPTWLPSTLSVSPSSPRISPLPAGYEASDHKWSMSSSLSLHVPCSFHLALSIIIDTVLLYCMPHSALGFMPPHVRSLPSN